MDFKQINKFAEYCRATLGNRLGSTELGNEYRYSMLPLCVVDAVYSIGVNYVGTARTVRDFATAVGLEGQALYRANWETYNSQAEQRQSISDFVAIQEKWAMQPTGELKFRGVAKEIYHNSQLTSSKYKSQPRYFNTRWLFGFLPKRLEVSKTWGRYVKQSGKGIQKACSIFTETVKANTRRSSKQSRL